MLPGLHSKYPRQTQRQDGPFFQHQCPVPKTSSSDAIVQAARDLTYALMHPATATPFAKIGANQLDAIQHLATIFDRAVHTPLGTPASSPRVSIVALTAPVPAPATMAPAPAQRVTPGLPIGAVFPAPTVSHLIEPNPDKVVDDITNRTTTYCTSILLPLFLIKALITLPHRSRPSPCLPVPFQASARGT